MQDILLCKILFLRAQKVYELFINIEDLFDICFFQNAQDYTRFMQLIARCKTLLLNKNKKEQHGKAKNTDLVFASFFSNDFLWVFIEITGFKCT